MAVKKRPKKQSAHLRRRAGAKSAGKTLCCTVCVVLTLCVGMLAALYHFGSFALRMRMEAVAVAWINTVRTPEWMPRLIINRLNQVYDIIPASQGLVVEGGEIGHDASPLIAGVPLSTSPLRVLYNKSYINLFDERQGQTTCIAFKLSGANQRTALLPTEYFEDPRVRELRVSDIGTGQWHAQPLVPPQTLASEFGEIGANEASLVTNLVPMRTAFHTGLWQRLIQEISQSYPQRFDETWIYLGPIPCDKGAPSSSGVPIPEWFYTIAFDVTAAGGLRAIAFLIPAHATDTHLHNYITSIERIEALSGLQFLPELEYDARDALKSTISPQLW